MRAIDVQITKGSISSFSIQLERIVIRECNKKLARIESKVG